MTVTLIPRPQHAPWMESGTDGLWERWMCEYEHKPGGTAQRSGPLDMVQLVVFWLLSCLCKTVTVYDTTAALANGALHT